MSDALKPDDFRSLAGPLVVLVDAGEVQTTVALIVESIDERRANGSSGPPFSLVLRGPSEPLLPESRYPVEHPALGTIEVLLKPLGNDAQAARYEAVFE